MRQEQYTYDSLRHKGLTLAKEGARPPFRRNRTDMSCSLHYEIMEGNVSRLRRGNLSELRIDFPPVNWAGAQDGALWQPVPEVFFHHPDNTRQ